jgi:hypothetical protein
VSCRPLPLASGSSSRWSIRRARGLSNHPTALTHARIVLTDACLHVPVEYNINRRDQRKTPSVLRGWPLAGQFSAATRCLEPRSPAKYSGFLLQPNRHIRRFNCLTLDVLCQALLQRMCKKMPLGPVAQQGQTHGGVFSLRHGADMRGEGESRLSAYRPAPSIEKGQLHGDGC